MKKKKKENGKNDPLTIAHPVLPTPTRRLTSREVQVMTQTAYGDNRGEISSMLGITRQTVKSHLDRVRMKLSARNRTHAVTVALVLGLINPYPRRSKAE